MVPTCVPGLSLKFHCLTCFNKSMAFVTDKGEKRLSFVGIEDERYEAWGVGFKGSLLQVA